METVNRSPRPPEWGSRLDEEPVNQIVTARMVRGAGAKEVCLRTSCPLTVSPCFYGVDTPAAKAS
jgi:hypothetical protein